MVASVTMARIQKLDPSGPRLIPVRIRVTGTKLEVDTTMLNPFYDVDELHGAGCDVGKAISSSGTKMGDAVKSAALIISGAAKIAEPIVGAASDLVIIGGTALAQPEIVVVGALGKAASALAGASKKRKLSAFRFIIIDEL